MLLQQHDNTALIWRNQAINYRERLERIDGYHRRFPETACAKVVLFSENRPEWVYAFYAGLKNGSILVPIDFMSSAEDVIILPNGKNINPVEIEQKLAGLTNAVAEAAVFLDQESLHAIIVPDLRRVREQQITDLE